MPQKEPFSFATELSEKGEATGFSDSLVLVGDLSISPGRSPIFEIDLLERGKISDLENQINRVDVKTESGKYVLWDCEKFDGGFFASYVTKGDIDLSKVMGFQVLISGVTSWFHKHLNIEIIDGKIQRENFKEKFSVVVGEGGDAVTVSNDLNFQCFSDDEHEAQTIINDEMWLGFRWNSRSATLKEIKLNTLKAVNLFSLLTGYPLGILKVRLLTKDKNFSLPIIWLSIQAKPHRIKWHKSIAKCDILFREDLWASIFQSSFDFKQEDFAEIFQRIMVVAQYELWDLTIFGYMSIWEKYSKGLLPDKKLSSKRKKHVKTELLNCLKNFDWKDEDDFKEPFEAQINGLSGRIYPTLIDALNYCLKQFPVELKEILELSESNVDDLRCLKGIRDDIAHANKTSVVDINRVIMLGDRVFVLLLCLAYLEMGITQKIIVEFFNPCSHKTVKGARLNLRVTDL